MQSGVALIAEASTIEAMRARRPSPRKPVRNGIVGALTVAFWAVWIYLVLPLVSLALWIAGVERFGEQAGAAGYRALLATLLSYSSVLLILVGALAIWIVWNVVRYGGDRDRRVVKAAAVDDAEVWESFRLDPAVGRSLRAGRRLRVELDAKGFVAGVEPHAAGEALGEPRVDGRADDRSNPVGTRVGEVKEVVEEGRVLR